MPKRSRARTRRDVLLTFGALASGALSGIALPTRANAAVDVGDIPVGRIPPAGWKDTQWQDPGGWTTIDVTQRGLPANSSGIDAAAKVREILVATSGRRILYFPPGRYHFTSPLTITNGGVILRGAGITQTRFLIDAPGASNAEIKFSGAYAGSPVDVIGSPASGAQAITVASTVGLKAGDCIELYQSAGRLAWGYPIETQIVRIASVSGNTLTLDMKIGLNYPASELPKIRRIAVLHNNGVEQLRIERVNQPTLENVNNLNFHYVADSFVRNIESIKSGRSHINLNWCKDMVVERNFVHDAFVKDTGGYAYGIAVNGACTGVRVSDNKLWDLRHNILLQMGANHCVISYNSVENPFRSYNDIALHATYAYMNLFEGNRFHEGYADNSKEGQGDLNATGPGNTWFRNYANNQIGCINGETVRQNLIGNKLSLIRLSGSDHYHGANLEGTTLKWGSLSPSSAIPASLYTTSKPAFLGSVSWPVYGPGVLDWGAANTLPATVRAKP
ncbi:hypothetical protein [Streptomyces sp. 2A115]|uniref:hypothetical protein n=1 Tax=Streptomyces sp. 2A115 TaxID=3457439 RepID=UPI003FD61063